MADRPLIFDSIDLGIARASNDIIIPGSLELNNGGTNVGLVFGGGTTASLSPALQGKIRYNESTNKFQVSTNAGAYVDLSTGSPTLSIGDTVVSGTDGSVLFLGTTNTLAQNNSKLFWDNTVFRLGIGNAAPAEALHVTGTGRFSASVIVDALTAGRVPYIGASGLISDISTLTFNSGTGTLTATALVGGNITDSALTSGRVVLAGTAGLLQDDSVLTFSTGTLSSTNLQATALTSGRVTFASTAGLLADASTLTFNSGTGALSATSLTATSLTSGRVPVVSTGGLLTDDSSLTFSTGTLTATAFVGGNVTDSALTSGRVVLASTAGLLQDDAALTFSAGTLSATALKATGLTSGRIPVAGVSGLLGDDAALTFSAGNLSTTTITVSGLTSGRVPFASTGGLLTDAATLLFSAGLLTATSLKATGLTSGRIPIVGTGGLIGDLADLTYSATTGQNITLSDAATNTVTDLLTLDHRSAGTAAANYGTGILFRGQDAAGTAGGDDIARIQAQWATATAGGEYSKFVIQTRTAGGALADTMTVQNGLGGGNQMLVVPTTFKMGLGTTSSQAFTMSFASNRGLLSTSGATATYGITFSVGGTAASSGAHVGYLFSNTLSNTSQTASTEIPNFSVTATTRQWATGALTTQREHLFAAPTYTFVGASTITNAATVAITAAPIASTNATITNAYALWVQAGTTRLDALLDLSGISAGSPNIKITATSDTPTVAFTDNGTAAKAPTTAPDGYLEVNVGGNSRYIPFWS